jgi:hypothetical protein
MLDLEVPRQRFVLRNAKPAAAEPANVPECTGPFTAEEWAKLHCEDRWLAKVLGAVAFSLLSIALVVFGTIAILAAFGWL